MIVLRCETEEGLGMFREHGWDICEEHNVMALPGPGTADDQQLVAWWKDGGRELAFFGTWRFAWADWAQFFRYVSPAAERALKAGGFHIYTYDARDYLRTAHQVVFDKATATRIRREEW